MGALSIARIDVGPESLEAFVRAEPVFSNTSAFPGLARRALALLPGLVRHTCENGGSHGMVAELAATETPHLLEHVAVECMALSGSPRSLRAETVWDFAADGPNIYRVRIAYDVDLVALAALREGLGIVDWLVGLAAKKPDMERIIAILRQARNVEV
jgi:cyanophycin synthetase